MRRYKRFLAILLAGTLTFSSVSVERAFATTDDILLEEDQDIITSADDADLIVMSDNTDEKLIDEEPVSENDIDGTDTSGDSEDEDWYYGYVEPEWAGEPVSVDEDLTIKDIDDMVEGEDIIVTEEGVEVRMSSSDEISNDMASIEPMSEYTDTLPKAFPSAYGDGSDSYLGNIDGALWNRLPQTRSQSPYGSCWAHESIALTEAYQINKQGKDSLSVDNSERHLVYNTFGSGSTYTGLDLNSYDSIDLSGANETVFLNQGGNALSAAVTLSKWRGVAAEEDAPYATIGSDSWTNTEFLSSAGRIENCYMINLEKNPDVVKRFVKEYGAAGISYYTLDGMQAMTDAKYYNAETNAYYYDDEVTGTNHGVVIVGWDDDFPKTAFAHTPGSNGAWLIRNSWKTGGSLSQRSYSSYFWMSYEDKGLAKGGTAYVYKMQDPAARSEHNYFYDATYHKSSAFTISEGLTLEAANVYRVSGSDGYEKLDSVNIQTFCDNNGDNTGYRIEVYSELTDTSKPDSGKLVAVKEGELPFLGLYTIRFDYPVILRKGTDFAVVAIINGGRKTVDYEVDANPSGKETYTVGAGTAQSFYKMKHESGWTDKRSKSGGNFCIGAQTSDYNGESCNVTVYSRLDTSTDSVANVSIASPKTIPGTKVTVMASDMNDTGYWFLGWYNADTIEDGKVTSYDPDNPLSKELEYTFTVDADTNLVAVYKVKGNARITVNVRNGAKYKVSDNIYVYGGGFLDSTFTRTFPLGKSLKLTAEEPDKVLQWENESGKVLGRGGSIAITLNRNMTITLVYKAEAENQAYLQFVSDYGQIISGSYVSTTSEDISIPAGPTKCGYIFNGWVFEGTEVEVDAASIKSRIPTAEDGKITAVPKYSRDNRAYDVIVKYKDKDGAPVEYQSQTQYTYNEVTIGEELNIVAPQIDGYTFECWKDVSGEPLGYKTSYYLLVNHDTEITACYVQNGEQASKPKPIITLEGPFKAEVNGVKKVCGNATRSIPEGYELEEQGMLYARDVNGLNEDNFITTNTAVNQYVGTKSTPNGFLYLSVKVSSDDTLVSLRGYMILREKGTNNTITEYSNIISGTYGSIN